MAGARMRAVLHGIFLCWLSLTAWGETLRVGLGTNKPPYIFEAERRGLEFDLIDSAAREAGMQMEPFFAPMERLHLMLASGQIDAIATTNAQSGVSAHYSQAYIHYQNYAVSLAKRQLDIREIKDLGRYSVSAFPRARLLLGPEFGAMAARNPNYREEAQQITRNRLLYAGRVDVIVGDRRIIEYFRAEVAKQVDSRQPLSWHALFPATDYHVGFRNPEQRDRFDLGLLALRKSGQYALIEQRYASY